MDEEKTVEHQDGTVDEDGNITHATVTVPNGCGPILNTQELSIGDGANNLPQDEGDGSGGSSVRIEFLLSTENLNSISSQHSSITSVVIVHIFQDEDILVDASFIMSDQDEDDLSLGQISVCSGNDMVGDPETRLPSNLLKDRKKKADFCINHVIKEANAILDRDSNIDGKEIEDSYNMSFIAKFAVPENWEPPTPKPNEKPFADVENPENYPQYCYCPAFKKNGECIKHSLPTGAMPVLLLPDVKLMNGSFLP
eukprot:7038830-Ditylum_brightwellii.AAC.1